MYGSLTQVKTGRRNDDFGLGVDGRGEEGGGEKRLLREEGRKKAPEIAVEFFGSEVYAMLVTYFTVVSFADMLQDAATKNIEWSRASKVTTSAKILCFLLWRLKGRAITRFHLWMFPTFGTQLFCCEPLTISAEHCNPRSMLWCLLTSSKLSRS